MKVGFFVILSFIFPTCFGQVIIIGDSTVCANQLINYAASAPNQSTILWSTGETTFSINYFPSPNEILTATITSSTNVVSSASISIDVYPLPFLQAGPDRFACFGSVINLTGTSTLPLPLFWDGIHSNPYSVPTNQNGLTTHTISTTSFEGCTSTDVMNLTVYAVPSVEIFGDSSICANDTVTISYIGNATSFYWNDFSQDTNRVISPSLNITYTLTGTNPAPGVSGGFCFDRDTLNMVINSLPINTTTLEISGISANADNQNYQWFNCLNNLPMPNANSQLFSVPISGTYFVQITTDQGCKQSSDCVNVTYVSLEEQFNLLDVEVYPNPFNSSILIRGFTGEFEIINELGVLLMNGKISNSNSINLADLTQGNYFLKLNNANLNQTIKIVKY